MDEFFTYDPLTVGSKGLVFIGEKILVYRRDHNTNQHPGELDLPGGGPESNETPFENFQREVMEEFGLRILKEQVTYARRYPSSLTPGKFAYFPVVKLGPESEYKIVFGDEGSEYMLMMVDDYIARDDAWSVFQDRTKDYLASN